MYDFQKRAVYAAGWALKADTEPAYSLATVRAMVRNIQAAVPALGAIEIEVKGGSRKYRTARGGVSERYIDGPRWCPSPLFKHRHAVGIAGGPACLGCGAPRLPKPRLEYFILIPPQGRNWATITHELAHVLDATRRRILDHGPAFCAAWLEILDAAMPERGRDLRARFAEHNVEVRNAAISV
jgi:hypothetical protein